jgi:hypothetical protein
MQTDGSLDTLSKRGSRRTYCPRAHREVSESQWEPHAKVMEEAGGSIVALSPEDIPKVVYTDFPVFNGAQL